MNCALKLVIKYIYQFIMDCTERNSLVFEEMTKSLWEKLNQKNNWDAIYKKLWTIKCKSSNNRFINICSQPTRDCNKSFCGNSLCITGSRFDPLSGNSPCLQPNSEGIDEIRSFWNNMFKFCKGEGIIIIQISLFQNILDELLHLLIIESLFACQPVYYLP